MLQQTWSRADSYDVVMLLVAELLEAHADTGIDLGTWPVPLAAVVSHLAQDPEGCEVLRAAAIEPWFTVIGTTKASRIIEAAKAADIELTRKEWYEIYLASGKDLP